MDSYESLLYQNRGVRNGVYTHKGKATNRYLAEYFGLKHSELDLLLSSGY